MSEFYRNVPFRDSPCQSGFHEVKPKCFKSKIIQFPPWWTNQHRLASGTDLDDSYRLQLYKKRWLWDKKIGEWRELDTSPNADIYSQLHPRKKEYVVHLSKDGAARTEIIKKHKVIGEWGPHGRKTYKTCWSRLSRGAKCGIICSLVLLLIGSILTAILVPLYAACRSGDLTETVCAKLGVNPWKGTQSSDSSIPQCTNGTCGNRGTCIVAGDGFICICSDGFTGLRCADEKVNVSTPTSTEEAATETTVTDETIITEETIATNDGLTEPNMKFGAINALRRTFILLTAISLIVLLIVFYVLRWTRHRTANTQQLQFQEVTGSVTGRMLNDTRRNEANRNAN